MSGLGTGRPTPCIAIARMATCPSSKFPLGFPPSFSHRTLLPMHTAFQADGHGWQLSPCPAEVLAPPTNTPLSLHLRHSQGKWGMRYRSKRHTSPPASPPPAKKGAPACSMTPFGPPFIYRLYLATKHPLPCRLLELLTAQQLAILHTSAPIKLLGCPLRWVAWQDPSVSVPACMCLFAVRCFLFAPLGGGRWWIRLLILRQRMQIQHSMSGQGNEERRE